jgi:hypothetical protein
MFVGSWRLFDSDRRLAKAPQVLVASERQQLKSDNSNKKKKKGQSTN